MKATLLRTAALMLGFGSQALPVMAADETTARSAAATNVQEIIVTAQRRSENIQNVPIAVTALTAAQIETAGLTTSTDLGKVTPGLVSIQGSGFYIPYIRGIGSASITPGNESTVATYVDGVYQTDKQGLLLSAFNDVSSLEVLRGPQGTLFGRNATAGAVLVTTRGPSDKPTGSFEGTYGDAEYGGRLFLAGPIAPTLDASVAAFYRRQDNYIRNLNPNNGAGPEVGAAESYGVRGKIRWEATPNFTATLAADYADSRDQGVWAPQAIAGTGLTLGEGVAQELGIPIPDIRNQRPVYAGSVPPLIHDKGAGESLTLQWENDFLILKSITAHREDLSSGNLNLDGTPLSLFYFQTNLKSNVWQQEVTVASKAAGHLNWQGGAYYLYYRDGYRDLSLNVGLPFPYSPSALAASPGSSHTDLYSYDTINSVGVFGDGTYDFTGRDKLTLGLRFTDERHSLDPSNDSTTSVPNGQGGILTLPPTTIETVCASTPGCHGLSTSFSQWTYRAVLSHEFSGDVMAYGSYNRGFKSGVYNISTITNVLATQPETVDAFEAGLKSQWLNRMLTVNTALYYNKYNNLQVAVTQPGTNTQISENAAKATTSGLEVEAVLRPTDRIILRAGASVFFVARYDSFPNCSVFVAVPPGGLANATADCSGKRLPATPNTFDLQSEYTFPLANGQSLVFDGLYSYTSLFNYAPLASLATTAPPQQPINTVNLSATWRSAEGRLHATFWGRDLVNQQNIFRGLFYTSFGYETTFARGATYGATLGYDF